MVTSKKQVKAKTVRKVKSKDSFHMNALGESDVMPGSVNLANIPGWPNVPKDAQEKWVRKQFDDLARASLSARQYEVWKRANWMREVRTSGPGKVLGDDGMFLCYNGIGAGREFHRIAYEVSTRTPREVATFKRFLLATGGRLVDKFEAEPGVEQLVGEWDVTKLVRTKDERALGSFVEGVRKEADLAWEKHDEVDDDGSRLILHDEAVGKTVARVEYDEASAAPHVVVKTFFTDGAYSAIREAEMDGA